MSQLDRHVATVRSREGTTRALGALAVAFSAVAALAIFAILLEKLLLWRPGGPGYAWLAGRPTVALGGAALLALIAGVAYGVMRRPTAEAAAVSIDARLGTKEKFSTALYLQRSPQLASDPFMSAAINDALATAERVDLAGQFPIRLPRSFGVAILLLALAFGLSYLRTFDLFGRQEAARIQQVTLAKEQEAKRQIDQVLTQINMATAEVQAQDEIKLAKQQLQDLASGKLADAEAGQRTAIKAQQALNDAQASREKIKNAQTFAKAKSNQKLLATLDDPKDTSPVSDVQRDIKKGDMDGAIEKLSKLSKEFDKMDEPEKQKAADQMQAMAQQLQQALKDDKQLQQLAQQMQQQAGAAGQQQMQQLQQLMQQAAQGNQQAAQQAQQQVQQMAQQAGATPQQLQQMQQLAQQMQGIQNSQAMMQQMQQAAQQMAGAMQQQAAQQQAGQQQTGAQQQTGQQQTGQQQAGQQGQQGQQQQSGQQQQAGQQQNGQQPGQQSGQQQGQQAGQQPGQQQGQQPGQQPGQQSGQQGGQQQGGQKQGGQQQGNQQGMNQGTQQMQDAMEAIKQDMKQMQAAQRGGQQGNGGQAGNGGQQGGGQQNGQQQGQGPKGKNGPTGEWKPGDPAGKQGQGMGGPGQGAGGKAEVQEAPFDFKEEISKSKDDDKGQVLAQTLVKADAEKGESTAQLREVVRSNLQESTDEVDSQRISRQAQKAVKDYFSGITGQADPAGK